MKEKRRRPEGMIPSFIRFFTKERTLKSASRMKENRMTIMFWILMLLAVLLVGRLVYLQIIASDYYIERNRAQVEDTRKLQSPRGTIFDRNGHPLAASAMSKSLYADPHMIKMPPEELAALLAPYVEMKQETIEEKLKSDTRFVWIQRMMDRDKAEAVQKIIDSREIEGVNFVNESKRYYPNGHLLAQVLGFVNVDDQGLDGLELVLDKYIRGEQEEFIIEKANNGKAILSSVYQKFKPKKEDSVTLTIDTTAQFIVERALDKAMQDTKAAGASVIIMDPKTGEILVMANRPTYDPSHFEKYGSASFTNRAVVNLYEPGSTFKPIIAAAALETKKWSLDTEYYDTGSLAASDHVIKNWNDEGYGRVKLLDILKYSINTGMAKIGLTVGEHDLLKYVRDFGFGKITDIELPGEGEGILFDEKTMVDIDTASMSIGQGIAVTPLQMVQAFGALANDGKMMKPHLIKSIQSPDGKVIEAEKIESVGQPISAEVAHQITSILEKEVSEGGGHNAYVEGYQFAGKTGTAEKLNTEQGGYLKGRYIASFIGYSPIEDPRFVALIVIDDPEGSFYGGQIAAPVFQAIMEQLVRYYQISPSTALETKGPKAVERAKRPDVTWTSDGDVILPDFRGWTMGEVKQWILDAGLNFRPTGSGFGSSQSPVGGTAVPKDGVVEVQFSE